MFRRLSIIPALMLITFGSVSLAQINQPKTKASGDRMITEMARSRNMPLVVGDSGVFVNTLLDGDGMPPEVRRILDLKEGSIALLIDHLDDTRLTRMSYCCNENPMLTVGDACLNMLSMIVEPTTPMFDKQCVEEEDDQHFCLAEGYDFSMSSFVLRGKLRIPSKEVVAAKQNWLKAYRGNHIKFKGY